MKESKVKGKVFLPAYVRRNTSVQQQFACETKTKHGNRNSIKLSELSPTLRNRVFDRPNKLAYTPFSKSI